MRIPGLKKMKLGMRRLTSSFEPHALILGYHRIADAGIDPFHMCISPRNFAQQMQVLKKLACPISLSQLSESLRKHRLPKRAAAITFDDGYSDLVTDALPVLEEHQIQAAVFIASGEIGKSYWWDRLQSILLSPDVLPEKLILDLQGEDFDWNTDDSLLQMSNTKKSRVRKQLLLELYTRLRNAHPEERERVIAVVQGWVGAGENSAVNIPRTMNVEELLRLSKDERVEIGSHSVSHPWLTALPENEQRREISQSKECLESIIGYPVHLFSYPNGSTSDKLSSFVKQAGYKSACTSENDSVRSGSDIYRLPRFFVPDWDGETFERWLKKWI